MLRAEGGEEEGEEGEEGRGGGSRGREEREGGEGGRQMGAQNTAHCPPLRQLVYKLLRVS